VIPKAVEDLPDAADSDDTQAQAVDAVSTDAAMALIAALPRDQPEAVLLRVVVGLYAAAAGRVLGKRPGAVRTAADCGVWLNSCPAAQPLPHRKRPTRPKLAASIGPTVGNGPKAYDAEDCDMPTNHHHEMDPETAERLLAGHGGGPPRLSGLLARAAGPAPGNWPAKTRRWRCSGPRSRRRNSRRVGESSRPGGPDGQP
jgi:hypothetical protein